MKKILLAVIPIIIVVLIVGGYIYVKKKQIKKPEVIKIKLPTGEVVDAYRIRFSTRIPVPEKNFMVLKGIVKWEEQEIAPNVQPSRNVILYIPDVNQKYVLMGPPAYVNTLIFNAVNKEVKLKVLTIGKTSFKDYEGLWIEDILEISK